MKVINVTLHGDAYIIEKINVKKINNVNTNSFVNDSVNYTKLFVKFNKDIISNYLNSKNVSTVIYKDFDSFILIFPLINSVNIKFDVNKSLSIRVMELLLKNVNIKSIECYFMPGDYVHLFAEKGLSIRFNNDMLFTPEFVSSNELKNLQSIYYRKTISFYNENELYANLESFLKVNNSIELIHLYFYTNEVIKLITDTVNKYNLQYVDIFIHQNEFNQSDIFSNSRFLRRLNKKYSNNKKREIKIIYSNEFFRNNIFRELTINGVKLCMIALLYVGVIFMISTKYHEYVALLNLRLLEETLADTTVNDGTIDDMDDEEVNPPIEEETPTPDTEEPPKKEYVNYYANIPTTFDKLLSINSDVVGWLSVNNTKINYPVTISSDNQYYLEHDIYNKKIITGWVFMDYRNNPKEMNQNTIIYGHNLISGYMFGSLSNALDREWYTNPDNQTIIFNTLDNEMNWRIISVYRTDYTTDYLKTGFFNDEEFMNFVSMIRERSIYNFNVEVESGDKILTLSTCTGSNNRRLVVHAVLV